MAYAISDATCIYWDELGVGDPLLLIMGLGYSLQMWHRTRPVLSAHYRTVAFDNRGVGRSDVPPGPYSVAQMASDAAVVLDAAKVDRAHVLGISMGGMIAQEFAIRYPQRTRSLVLGCTACGGRAGVRAAQNVTDILMSRANMAPEDGFRAMAPFIYDASTPRERIEEDLAMRRLGFPTPGGYLAQLQAILSWTSIDRLQQIQAPTLIMHGESDQLVPPGNAQILGQQIRGSKVVMLPHASHIFTTDQPELAHREMLEFLAAVA